MFRTILGLVVLISLMGSLGCDRESRAIPASKRSGWRASMMESRTEKDRMFSQDSMSPMAAIDWFELIGSGPHGIRVDEIGVSHVPVAESDYRIIENAEGAWEITDTEQESRPFPFDTPVDIGDRYVLVSYGIDGGILIRVFDRERPEYAGFQSLRYFDPDPDYAVTASVERLNEPEEVEMTTSRNRIKTYLRVARLHFSLQGKEQVLAAYKMSLDGPYSNIYFIPFRDATSGKETYGAGRFLELDEPRGDSMVLDFNKAFNPLCNYSPAYNCPLPPAENTLLIPIRAGEKTYPHDEHRGQKNGM